MASIRAKTKTKEPFRPLRVGRRLFFEQLEFRCMMTIDTELWYFQDDVRSHAADLWLSSYHTDLAEGEETAGILLRNDKIVWPHEQISDSNRSHPDPINPTTVVNGTIRGYHRDDADGYVEFQWTVPEGFEVIEAQGILDTLGATSATFGKGIHAFYPGRGVHIEVNGQRIHTFVCNVGGQYGDYWAENGPYQRLYVTPIVAITPIRGVLRARISSDAWTVVDVHQLEMLVTLRPVVSDDPPAENNSEDPQQPQPGIEEPSTPPQKDPGQSVAALKLSDVWELARREAMVSAAVDRIFGSASISSPLDELLELTIDAIVSSEEFRAADAFPLLENLSASHSTAELSNALGRFSISTSVFAAAAEQVALNGNPEVEFSTSLGKAMLEGLIADSQQQPAPLDFSDGLSPEELLITLAAPIVASGCFYPRLYLDMGAAAFSSYPNRLEGLTTKPPVEQHWVSFAESGVSHLRQSGWMPMTTADLGVDLDAEGRYAHWSGGSVQFFKRESNGRLEILFGITGTDQLRDVAGWIAPDVHYLGLESALEALTAFVNLAQPACVYGTGHSLGGTMLQTYLARLNSPDDDRFRAVTFGSPGASLHDSVPDDRIAHIVSAHDVVGAAGRNTLPASIELAGLLGSPPVAAITNIVSAARDAWRANNGSQEAAEQALFEAVTAFTTAFPSSSAHQQQVERLIRELLFQPAGGRDQIGHFAYTGPTIIINSDAALNNLEEHSIARYVHSLACLDQAGQAVLLRDSSELADTTYVTAFPECHPAQEPGGTGGNQSGGSSGNPAGGVDLQQLLNDELFARTYVVRAVSEALGRAFIASQQALADQPPPMVFIPGLQLPDGMKQIPGWDELVDELATAVELRLSDETVPTTLLEGVASRLESFAVSAGNEPGTINAEAVVQFATSLSRSLMSQFVTPTIREEIGELLDFIPSDFVAEQLTVALTQVVDEALYQVATTVLSPLAQPLGNAIAGIANAVAATTAYQALNSVFQASNPALLVAAAVSAIAFGDDAPDSDIEALFRSITLTGEPISSILLTAFNFITYVDARRDAAKARRLAESTARDKTVTQYIMAAIPAIYADDARMSRLVWTAQADLREAEHEHRGDRQHHLALDAMGVLRDQILDRQVAFPLLSVVPFSYGGEDGIEIGRNIMVGVVLGAGSQAMTRLTGRSPEQLFAALEGRAYQHNPDDYAKLMSLQKVMLDARLFVSPHLVKGAGDNLLRLPSTVHTAVSASGHDHEVATIYDGSYDTAAIGSVNCAGRGGCGVHLETVHEFVVPAHVMAITAAVQVHSYATGSYIRDHAGSINLYYSTDGGMVWQAVPNAGRGYSQGDGDTETQLADVITLDLHGVTHIKLIVSASGNASGGEGNAGADFEIRELAVFGEMSASDLNAVAVALHTDPLVACEGFDDRETASLTNDAAIDALLSEVSASAEGEDLRWSDTQIEDPLLDDLAASSVARTYNLTPSSEGLESQLFQLLLTPLDKPALVIRERLSATITSNLVRFKSVNGIEFPQVVVRVVELTDEAADITERDSGGKVKTRSKVFGYEIVNLDVVSNCEAE